MNGQGILERTWKVREKSGNLKIMAMAGNLQKIYLFYSRGESMYFLMRKLKLISLLIGGLLLRKEFAPIGSKFFNLRVTPDLK